jgi:UDP-glucose 4-epimerase
MAKKILLTGGNGFIGGYVIEELLARGYKVLVFDHSMPGQVMDPLGPRAVEYFQGDIRDSVAVTEAAAHCDGIIHLAAVLGTQETIKNPRPAADTNIQGGLNVFEAADQYGLPVVYAGVGNHWMRSEGGGTYTITKTAVEDFAKMYIKNRGTRISVVRPVNAYGPRQSVAAPFGSSKVRKIMPSFVCRALTGQDIEVYGGGNQVSDCVYVADVARVFVAALEYTMKYGSYWEPGFSNDAFEVGPAPHESMSVRQIAEMVIDLSGSKSQIRELPMRPGEVSNSIVSAQQKTLAPLLEF